MTRCSADSDRAAGFVLAGGRSSRLGRDKALALFAGVPLIRLALSTIDQVGIPARIAGFRSDLSGFGAGIPDHTADAGPLGGVYSALTESSAQWNLFLPVDMPLLPESLLAALLWRAATTRAPVTAATLGGVLQPFPVVLSHAVLPLIRQRLNSGATACHLAWKTIPRDLGTHLDAVSVESLSQSGLAQHRSFLPPFHWFQGVNTATELARLERIALRRGIHSASENVVSFE